MKPRGYASYKNATKLNVPRYNGYEVPRLEADRVKLSSVYFHSDQARNGLPDSTGLPDVIYFACTSSNFVFLKTTTHDTCFYPYSDHI